MLMLTLIPSVIPSALPLGMLTAILLVLGRMSSSNEILAMKAAGISIYRIGAPIFFLATLGTGVATGISLYYAPLAKSSYRNQLSELVKNDPLRFVQPQTYIKDFPGYVIYVRTREDPGMRDIYIWDLSDDNRTTRFIEAETGELTYNEQTNSIELLLKNAVAEVRDSEDLENFQDMSLPPMHFGEIPLRLSLDEILGESASEGKLSLMTLNQLLEKRRNLQKTGSEQPEEEIRDRLIEIQMAIQTNLAMAFAVISLSSIALPLSIKISRSESYANIAVAVMLGITYLVIFTMLKWLEQKPELRPDILIWLPNILFQSIGLYALNRSNQH